MGTSGYPSCCINPLWRDLMEISQEQKEKLEQIYQSFLHDEKIMRMKDIPMHRGSSCYMHSFKVAKLAIKRALRSRRKNISLEVILIGAILHDYYLYDWRKDRSKLKGHAKKHSMVAAENALRDYDISPEIKKVIESHMWPFNFKNYPNTYEAKIVNTSDTAVAFREALTTSKHKEKHNESYISYISKLF